MSSRKIVKMYERLNTINLLVFVADLCNYSCEYCYNQKPRSGKMLDMHKLMLFIQRIRQQSDKELYIQLIGGEPTLHPGLHEFCKEALLDKKNHVLIYTNFSKDVEYYEALLQLNNLSLTLTYHARQMNEFIDKLKKISCLGKSAQIDIRIMVDPMHFSNFECAIENILNVFPKNTIPLLLDMYDDHSIQFLKNTFYTCKQLERYRYWLSKCNEKKYFTVEYDNNETEKISVNTATDNYEFNHFKYWKCNAGMEYMYIDQHGNVFTCITTTEKQRKALHNIYSSNSFVLPTKPIICLRDECQCTWEVYKERVLAI